MSGFFASVLDASLAASILAAAVAALRLPLRGRAPKGLLPVLWAVVFLRFAVPVSVPSPVSVWNTPPAQAVSRAVSGAAGTAGLSSAGAGEAGGAPAAAPSRSAPPAGEIAGAVYLMGLAAMLALAAGGYLRALLRFRGGEPVRDAAVEGWIRDRGLRRRVTVLRTPLLGSPAAFGVFRPKLLFPADFDFSDRAAARLIVEHELQHVARFDTLAGLLSLLVACFHWFNPVAWACRALLSADLEAACDESVLRRLGEGNRRAYARALLAAAGRQSGFSFARMSFGERGVRARIAALMRRGKRGRLFSAAAVALAGVVVAVFATAAGSAEHARAQTAFGLDDLESALRARGYAFDAAPFAGGEFPEAEKTALRAGGETVRAYLFATPQQAARAAEAGSGAVSGNPLLYRKGRLLVLCPDADAKLRTGVAAAMGRPVAAAAGGGSSSDGSSSGASPRQDVFMAAVQAHGYAVVTNSEAGGVVTLPESFDARQKSIPIGALLRAANEKSRQEGLDFSSALGKTVTFHTCGIDPGGARLTEADAFELDGRIAAFWVCRMPAGADKTDTDSYRILAALS